MFRISAVLTRDLRYLVRVSVIFSCFTAYAQAGQVALAWDASTKPTLGGYQLYHGQASGNYTVNVDVGNQISYTVANLQDGNTYYFAVKAYDTTKSTWSGYSNEVSKTITSTTTGLTASFTASPTSGTAPLIVTFTDTSTGNITAWSWSFGDGSTSTAKTAVKTYSNSGSYTATLTVSGPGGSNTTTKTISVTGAAPVANFSATPLAGAAPLAVTFTNTSTGTVSGYNWNFGDGGTSTQQNSTHTYTSAGTFTASLKATGPGGETTKTQTITVSLGGGSNTSRPVAAYAFDEVSGSKVIDASGRGNHGTSSGATPVTSGRFGKALSFDGVDDWVTVNDAASLDLTTGMTLEAWVYPTVDMTDWRSALIKENPAHGLAYGLYANSDTNQPAGSVHVGGDGNLHGGPWLVPNTWAHLATTYDGAIQRLYVNGTEVANRARSGSIEVSNGVLRIGGNSFWGEFFKGRIDEVRIYNQALSASQIQADSNTAVATSSPPVRAMGVPTVGSVADSNPQGTAQAFKTQATVTAWVTTLSVYIDTGSTTSTLVAGIYADNNGIPGARLARGTLTSPGSGGWKKVAIPPVLLQAGTKYWIAILSPSGELRFRHADTGDGGLSETSAQTTLTDLPSPWTSGNLLLEGPVSAYGTGYP